MRRLIVLALACTGCLALPPSSLERLNQTAYEHNAATRFGRMDVAAETVASEARADFGKRHRAWGREVKIVDVELEGLQVTGPDTAEVELLVSWHRIDDPTIQVTTLAQHWSQGTSDWRLVEETVVAGPAGLFPRKAKSDAAASTGRSALVGSVDLP